MIVIVTLEHLYTQKEEHCKIKPGPQLETDISTKEKRVEDYLIMSISMQIEGKKVASRKCSILEYGTTKRNKMDRRIGRHFFYSLKEHKVKKQYE
jgi:hypothetical protein